jgi:hypothetical protein
MRIFFHNKQAGHSRQQRRRLPILVGSLVLITSLPGLRFGVMNSTGPLERHRARLTGSMTLGPVILEEPETGARVRSNRKRIAHPTFIRMVVDILRSSLSGQRTVVGHQDVSRHKTPASRLLRAARWQSRPRSRCQM